RVVVSGQFLLDSEASIKASASRLRGAQTDAEPVVVEPAPEGMATITAVKADARVLTLDHEPIEALGWPAMVMDLDVGAAVDLEGLAVGDRIHFTLEQGEDGGYRIGSIHVLE
ncbi:MAG: copper-binding protein, partial [Gammaproteobacteria bacterium]|nr:copper-binding protein [Gammaproteobacteria bacterium]